jgi:hypothetical protein
MARYNLYYNYEKINNKPLSEDEIIRIKNIKYVYKQINGNNIKIPVSKIKFTKCLVI